MLSEDIASSRAKISGVLMKSKFDQALLGRVNDIYDAIYKVIFQHLEDVGMIAVQTAKDNIASSSPSGIRYVYLNNDGSIEHTHTSSSPGNAPVSASGDLMNAITFRRNPDGWVEVGIYDNSPGGWPTLAFLGHGNAEIREKYPDLVGEGTMFVRYGGTVRTTIMDYAFYLEYGTDRMAKRPFLGPAMIETIQTLRKQLRKEMKAELAKRLRRKNPPIYFRVSVKS
jgi:hypothetical protein